MIENIGAGEGNRTLVISLEGCCSTIELHPRRAGGGGRTRTYEGVSQRIYSPPPLPLGTLPRTTPRARPAGASRGRYMVGWQGLVNHVVRQAAPRM